MRTHILSTCQLVVLSILVFISSSCAKKSQNDTNSNKEDEIYQAYEKAMESPINERKLFGGFEIGMSPQQVDSVFNVWVKEGKVISWDEAGKTYATIDMNIDNASIKYYAYQYDVGLPYTLDIQFYPTYLDNQLVSLFCSVKTPKENMNPKEVYKFLADEFEKTERGKEFQKFELEEDGSQVVVFLKDNLEIIFFAQSNLEESSIEYNNIPSMEKLGEERQKENPIDML